jgi:hypothetical protein
MAGFEPATSLLKGEVSATYATAKLNGQEQAPMGIVRTFTRLSFPQEVTINYAMPETCVGGNKQIRCFLMKNEVTESYTTPTGFDYESIACGRQVERLSTQKKRGIMNLFPASPLSRRPVVPERLKLNLPVNHVEVQPMHQPAVTARHLVSLLWLWLDPFSVEHLPVANSHHIVSPPSDSGCVVLSSAH